MAKNPIQLVGLSRTDIENSINRQRLLINHEIHMAELEGADKLKKNPDTHQFKNENEHQDAFDLDLRKRVTIMDLVNAEMRVCQGKFFLGRMLVPWVASRSEDLDKYHSYTVVEDPEGKHGFQLNVYMPTQESRSELEASMSPGTYLAVLDPFVGVVPSHPCGICLYTERSKLIANQNILKSLSVVWKGEVPSAAACVQSQDEYRRIGNQFFVQKNYREACFFYTKGLSLSQIQKDINLLSNRAAAYLGLHCYQLALQDAEEVLSLNPTHFKAIYRKIRALCGLRRYEASAAFLQTKLKSVTESDDLSFLEKLQTDVEEYVKQSKTGHYDILSLAKSTMYATETDCAEYIGPFELRADKTGVKKIAVVATREIQPGELIMAIRAFGSVPWMDHDAMVANHKEKRIVPQFSHLTNPYHEKLVDIIKTRLLKEPEMVPKFFDIEVPAINDAKHQNIGFINPERISKILSYRGFITPYRQKKRLGVYLEPSFLSHNCFEYNSRWIILGDVHFVRAVKSIGKDDEIIISKTQPFEPYSSRTNLFNRHNAPCKCKLCVAEEALGIWATNRADELQTRSRDNYDLASLKKTIVELERLKAKQPVTNVNHTKLYINVATTLQYECNDKPAAFSAWRKVFELLQNTPYINDLLEALICMNDLATNRIFHHDFKKNRCEKELQRYWSILVGPENVDYVLRNMDKNAMIEALDLV